MSEDTQQQQQQQQRSKNAVEASVSEDNFSAMREAALSMFKQRTKDLTMVSARTTEAQQLEELNGQLQSTIDQLHEQKAQLEALIETEERRSREREGQLREVHTLLAQMKEDQGFFSGVQRASEKVIGSIHDFVTSHTSRAGEVARLLERGYERTQGRAPNDWRNAANDMRRRQAILTEHIRQMERQAAVPQGLLDAAQEWARGTWCQLPEYAPAWRLCEQLLQRDAAVQCVAERLPPSLSPPPFLALSTPSPREDIQTDDNNGGMKKVDEEKEEEEEEEELGVPPKELEEYVTWSLQELDALGSMAAVMEKECEAVGLCCAIAPTERMESIRAKWQHITQLQTTLCETQSAVQTLQSQLDGQTALHGALSERVALLEEQERAMESNLCAEEKALAAAEALQSSMLCNTHTALRAAQMHIQHATSHHLTESEATGSMMRLEGACEAAVAAMLARWDAMYTQTVQMRNEATQEEAAAATAAMACDVMEEEVKREEKESETLRDACKALEVMILQEMEDTTPEPLSACAPMDPILDAEDADASFHLVDWDAAALEMVTRVKEGNGGLEAFAPGLGSELAQRVEKCILWTESEGSKENASHLAWIAAAEEEIASLAAE